MSRDSDNTYQRFDFPTVRDDIFRNRTAINRGTNRKEQQKERKMCGLVIVECGLTLRRVRNVCVKEIST